ncbi:MAG: response regulator [Proteobacteria bacterium]|nr:response regulator [Pseudomonadota bacterium]
MNSEKKEKILFVDDEENILEVIREYFEFKGYAVVTAQNGREAVKILENEKIDCCFTDINMPEMDGIQLAEHIWRTDNTIPVVIMTGKPTIDYTIKTIKHGVVDFLVKPVNLNDMELCIERILNQRKLFIENILLKKEVEGKKRLEELTKQLQNKVDDLRILNKIISEFTEIGSTKDVFKRLVDMATEISLADMSKFYVINGAVNRIFETATCPKASGPEIDQTLFERLLMNVTADSVPFLVSENRCVEGLSGDIFSFMCVPLKIREKVFGLLTAYVTQGEVRFSEKDLYYLSFMTQNAAQAIENLALYENIYDNLFATLYGFVSVLDARDSYTQIHSNRVTDISIIIGRELGCTTEELDILNVAGRLHDIGKIGIRDEILLKPGKLTKEEFEKIKEHPLIGANIIKNLGFWEREIYIIKCHHERFDGTGYPDGLKGKEIPLLSRILSIADVYDALASDRPYRAMMDEKSILKYIQEGAGTQFDPELVEVFMKLYNEGKIIK